MKRTPLSTGPPEASFRERLKGDRDGTRRLREVMGEREREDREGDDEV